MGASIRGHLVECIVHVPHQEADAGQERIGLPRHHQDRSEGRLQYDGVCVVPDGHFSRDGASEGAAEQDHALGVDVRPGEGVGHRGLRIQVGPLLGGRALAQPVPAVVDDEDADP